MRYALTDREWNIIQPILPSKPRGIPRVDDRGVINGILWVLQSGAPWRDLPDRYGPYRPATIASSVGGELASGTGSWMGSVPLTTRRFR
jgi:transposase